MADSTIWWLLAGVAVAVELVTGTFYLLMLAIGMVAAALAAHLGAPVIVQIVVAALVGGGAVVAWHWKRSKSPKPAQANANSDVQMDIGQTVHVQQWNDDATASVKYRGAQWTVQLADPDAAPQPGLFKVKELNGNRLVVAKL
ncbi:NfeD family protein [Polaromonas sp. SM01]|uniref:NfeD family protein n=1 Tax=Polaromonas sp. SM01 TaxID=3085630 RepID=UPI002981230E|nr:NfeD family protein [Polaromonas sp. SM01]MDW5444347.1 NfeD family protein [Polaromonas sp. SM01]